MAERTTGPRATGGEMNAEEAFNSIRDDSDLSETTIAILVLADAGFSIARQLKALGNADAATPMGALEAIGGIHKEGMERLAEAVATSLNEVSVSLDVMSDKLGSRS